MDDRTFCLPRRLSAGAAGQHADTSTESFSRRPQVYASLAVGLSWSPDHAPNIHGIAYQSRGLRDRLANVPRETTASPEAPDPASAAAATAEPQYIPPSYDSYYYYQFLHNQGDARQDGLCDDWESLEQENCQNLNPAGGSAAPQLWKPLPEIPGRYRLGEAELPWSVGPDVDPDDERLHPWPQTFPCSADFAYYSSNEALPSSCRQCATAPIPAYTNPTVLPIESRAALYHQPRDADPQRRRDLENLSAALVTVDNGFENQWWNQGERLSLLPGATTPNTGLSGPVQRSGQSADALLPDSTTRSAAAAGRTAAATAPFLARAATDSDMVSALTPSSTPAQPWRHMRVSPVSESGEQSCAGSPPRTWQLSRSISTRSEELFLSPRHR